MTRHLLIGILILCVGCGGRSANTPAVNPAVDPAVRWPALTQVTPALGPALATPFSNEHAGFVMLEEFVQNLNHASPSQIVIDPCVWSGPPFMVNCPRCSMTCGDALKFIATEIDPLGGIVYGRETRSTSPCAATYRAMPNSLIVRELHARWIRKVVLGVAFAHYRLRRDFANPPVTCSPSAARRFAMCAP